MALDEEGKKIVTHSNDALTLKYAAEGDYAFDAGLNRFVWDMRYPLPSSIPGRPPTAIQPIAKPGTYSARLTVDGVSETREFELFINPGEPYTREQTDERFEFWMDLYNNVEASSQNVLAALKLKQEILAKVETMKGSRKAEAEKTIAEIDAGSLSPRDVKMDLAKSLTNFEIYN